MTLKAVYDTVDDVPEALREFYTENNGKFGFVGVEGWKPQAEFEKVTTALNSERKLRKQHEEAAGAWSTKFAGKTIDEVAQQLDRIPVLEAESQGKVDQKKLDSILDQTVKNRLVPYEAEIAKQKAAVIERDQKIAQYQAAEKRRSIHDAVRAVAAKEGFQESAYSNAEGALLLLSERHFTVNEYGQVVVSDDNVTYTPGLPISEALTQIKQHHPYLLKQSVGGGATGNTGIPGVSGSNPFMANNMTARAKFMQEHPDKWQQAMQKANLSAPMEQYKSK